MLNFYLYSVTSISLTVFYIASIVLVNGLLRLFLGIEIDESASKNIAAGAGFATVSLPMWWIHWRWLQQQFKQAEGEAVTWHRFYLFTIVCLNAMAILISGSIGVMGLVGVTLGVADGGAEAAVSAGVALFAALLSVGLWLQHWRQFRGGIGELLPQTAA